MNPKIIIAIILIALGITAFAYQGITYTTRGESRRFDPGPIQMMAEKTKPLPLLPIVGAIAWCWLWEAKKSHGRQNNHAYRR